MTQIGVAVIDIPAEYRYRQYVVTMRGGVDRYEDLHALRELFSKSREGTAIHYSCEGHPLGEDMDVELRNTQYVQFSHGDRPVTAWYLLRGFSYFGDETPMGADRATYVFTVELFFLGTIGYYAAGFAMKDLDEATSDWGI